MGSPIPFTTLAKAEQGRVDLGLRRLHILLKLYQVPIQMAEDLLDLEAFAGDLPIDVPAGELYQEGLRHWKAGDLQKGLARLFAVRSIVPHNPAERVERQKALLSFAIAAGSLGKHRLAREIIDGLLIEPPQPDLLVSVLVQAAVCWHWLGSCDAALGFLAQAEERTAPGDHQRLAWVFHERASTLATMGRPDDAERALDRALEEYRARPDAYGESLALGVRVRLRYDRGDYEGALAAAREGLRHAESHAHARVQRLRRVDEGRSLLALGKTGESLAALDSALSEAVAADDAVVRFFAHYYLWKAREAAGDAERAASALRSAQEDVASVDAHAPEAVEVRASLAVAAGAGKTDLL